MKEKLYSAPARLKQVRRRTWIYAALAGVLIIAVAVALIIMSRPQQSNMNDTASQDTDTLLKKFGLAEYEPPACGDKQYSHAIVGLDQIDSVTPLGNYAPPDHTLPTEHLYFRLTDTGQLNDLTDLYSPGDIYITSVAKSTSVLPDLGEIEEYVLFFSLCDNIHGYLDHIDDIAPRLKSRLKSDSSCINTEGSSFCETRLDEAVPFKAGDVIGAVGAPRSQSFDFGTYDFTKHQEFANPARYVSRTPYIVCPFDYYPAKLKRQLYSKLESVNRTCGVINYDTPGTLVGNWFYGDVNASAPNSWNKHLSFGSDNTDPNISVISIGGVFTEPSVLAFRAKHKGSVNRSFDIVRPSDIFCYQDGGMSITGSANRVQGKLLVRLDDKNTLHIERQSGSCNRAESFTSSTEYAR